MPTPSSSASDKKPVRRTRKTTSAAKKKTKTTRTRRASKSDAEVEETESVASEPSGRSERDEPDRSDSFGDGLEDFDFINESADDDDSYPASRAETPEKNEEVRASSSGESSSGESSSSGDEATGDEAPRRRRRRRRRGGGEGEASNTGGNAGGGNAGGGGRGRGRGRAATTGSGGGGGGAAAGGGGGGAARTSRGRGRGGRGTERRGERTADFDRNRRAGRPTGRRPRAATTTFEDIEGPFEGVLELHPKGYGFLREREKNYVAHDSNPFVSSSVVEKYALREGVLLKGEVGPGTRGQGPRLQEVELIDGLTPEEYLEVRNFDELTPINPFEQIRLETETLPLTMRVMDLLCPIGKGQRALLVAPPRTGKTMLLQDIANAVTANHPEIHLMVLLIDERPEEVTEMSRTVQGEVISSSLDQDVESHVRLSQLIIERGKRMAESGKDVLILVDSITRLARAFNKWIGNSGRTATGGLDIRALDAPKKMFGTARRFDEGGSLTVVGTALIDTGSRMDEAIFQEFKGTGNMELVLSRDLADRRIWPAIDITRSGTRREEKILDPDILDDVTTLRRSLINLSPVDAMTELTKALKKFPTNAEFLTKIRAVL